MKPNKKQQLCLFLVGISASSAASASTCTQGFYDPNNGSNCIAASPGHYVSASGATMQQTALPGYFVGTSGATVALPAAPGTYVPFAGSSAPTTAGTGFYVPFTTSVTELPGGGMAAPIVAATQTNMLFQNMLTGLADDGGPRAIKATIAYQHDEVDQTGLNTNHLKTDVGAFAFEGDLYQGPAGKAGIQFAYGHHDITTTDDAVNNYGNSYQGGAFGAKNLLGGQGQASLFYGKTFTDNKRNINTDIGGGTDQEVLTANDNVSWYGMHTKFSHPLIDEFSAAVQLSAIKYRADSFTETGTTASGGSALAALGANALNYTSVPSALSISYDVLPKAPGMDVAPIELTGGIARDLNGKKNLLVHSVYSFELPVEQTSMTSGFGEVKFNAWQFSHDIALSGVIGGEYSNHGYGYQAGLNLVKKW